jgi:hypothetical protein
MVNVTKTSQDQWPSDWETKSITDDQFAVKSLRHWSVPIDLAEEYVEIFGHRKASELSMEASVQFTDHGLNNPRAYVRSVVKDELLFGRK